jgi:hypothetical protein
MPPPMRMPIHCLLLESCSACWFDVRLELLLRWRRYRHRGAAAGEAGDTILVHAGLYKYHPEFYTGARTIEGTYYLTASGT